MKTVYWNIDNNVAVMPENAFNLKKALKHAVIVRPRINKMDVVVAPQDIAAVSLIDLDINNPEIKLVKCHWTNKDRPIGKDAVDEQGNAIPVEIETLMRF